MFNENNTDMCKFLHMLEENIEHLREALLERNSFDRDLIKIFAKQEYAIQKLKCHFEPEQQDDDTFMGCRRERTEFEIKILSRERRFLVVDDEIDIVEALENILLDLNQRVEVAYNGEDGLNMLRKNKFDCIITDFKMPGLDGVEMIETARNQRIIDNDTKVIVITGGGRDTIGNKANSSVIQKPFTRETLLSSLCQF